MGFSICTLNGFACRVLYSIVQMAKWGRRAGKSSSDLRPVGPDVKTRHRHQRGQLIAPVVRCNFSLNEVLALYGSKTDLKTLGGVIIHTQ